MDAESRPKSWGMRTFAFGAKAATDGAIEHLGHGDVASSRRLSGIFTITASTQASPNRAWRP